MPAKTKTTPVKTPLFHATLWSSTGMPLRRVKVRWLPEGLEVNRKLIPRSELRAEGLAPVTIVATGEVIA
jgi:hypothetical protein